ncbi:hypothetical protein RJ639_037306 [Escallonia herrerae]|uniref:Dihydrolipoamide acetyltransferase component of pyruvate dehydrogenase complex n=1 Tax=Escallonia herrerae TaxID=1293975 RepID=A0AA88WRC0_9ASTE|nr:hypothetical protein RJ639_037306 [Escallonia herrerae]
MASMADKEHYGAEEASESRRRPNLTFIGLSQFPPVINNHEAVLFAGGSGRRRWGTRRIVANHCSWASSARHCSSEEASRECCDWSRGKLGGEGDMLLLEEGAGLLGGDGGRISLGPDGSDTSTVCTKSIPNRNSKAQNFIVDGDVTLLRFTPFYVFGRVYDNSSKLKLPVGVRYFSSAEPPSHLVIGMPALSPTMSQGNIAKWRKKEGDKVGVPEMSYDDIIESLAFNFIGQLPSRSTHGVVGGYDGVSNGIVGWIEVGDVICDIETDKATLEFESLEEGFLAKILVPEGSKDVPVGQPIAITVEDSEDLQNVPAVVTDGSEAKEKQSVQDNVTNENKQPETSSAKISASDLPPHIILEMPALSPTMNQGNIAKWRKKEGDKIEVGDVICDIETDKATLEFECLEEGFIAKILAPDDSKDVTVGQAIAITVEDMNDIEAVKTSIDFAVMEEKLTHGDTRNKMRGQNTSFSRISPSAKLLITEHGLDASLLIASGPRGTLLKGDVLAAIKSGKGSAKISSSEKIPESPQIQSNISSASAGSGAHIHQSDFFEDLPNSQIRKFDVYFADVILDPLLSFRKELKEKYDVKVSVNDIVIKAVAIALRNVPEANGVSFTISAFDAHMSVPLKADMVGARADGSLGILLAHLSSTELLMSDGARAPKVLYAYWNAEKGEVVLCDSVDISIAVATEKGLMTPIVKNADQKSISRISSEVKELAEKARTGKLTPTEFQGGTFSISNLGMFPVDHFSAIINPPQGGILAVGRGNQVVVPVAGSDGIEKPAVVTKINLTLSADHRVIEGKVGGAFVAALRSNFSDIRKLLL